MFVRSALARRYLSTHPPTRPGLSANAQRRACEAGIILWLPLQRGLSAAAVHQGRPVWARPVDDITHQDARAAH